MPIPSLSGPVVVPPTDPPVRSPRYVAPTVLLTGARGEQVSLTGSGRNGPVVMPGVTGIGLPVTDLYSEPLPDGDGSVLTGIRYADREVFIPVLLGAADYVGLREQRRRLERILNAKAGPVAIGISQPDTGETRTASGIYMEGMEGAYGRSDAGIDWQIVGLVIRCLDPFWYGELREVPWSLNEGLARPFLSQTEPFYPVVLGQTLVAGARTLRNEGEELADTVITVTGPGDGLVVENATTGQLVELDGVLEEDQWVTFDSRTGVADAFDQDGDVWDRVSTASRLWGLVPGDNQVRVSMTNADNASRVLVSWRPPFTSGH